MRTRRRWIARSLGALAAGLVACGPSGEDAAGDRPAAGSEAASGESPDPARIVRELRPRVSIANRPDPAFSLEERMALHHVPGVSVAVIDDHRIVWSRGYGVRAAGEGTPVDTLTRFQAGSISKPVFASGAMKLVEDGVLSLDEDVNGYLASWTLPESRFDEDRLVTLRHLLSHTAGLTVHGFPGYGRDEPVPTVPQVLDGAGPANTEAVRSDTLPGARFSYSGGGYTVAQLAAADVTGEALPALMERLVLRPAGMDHSTFRNPPGEAHLRHAASGHEQWDTPVEGGFHVYPEMAAAGLWTTAPDLARWAIAVSRSYRGEGGFLSRETAREMLAPQVEMPGDGPGGEAAWGLGPALSGSGETLRFTHGGRNEGFVATVSMWPSTGRGLVVLTNGVSNALLREIEGAFGTVYGLDVARRVEKRVLPVEAVPLDGLAGRYRLGGPGSGLVVEIRREASGLTVDAPGLVTDDLLPEAPDVFFDRATGTTWRFERPDGAVDAPAVRLHVTLAGSRAAIPAERAEPEGGRDG